MPGSASGTWNSRASVGSRGFSSSRHQHRAGGEEVTGAEGEDGTCGAGVSSCRARRNVAHAFLPANAADLDKPSLESQRRGLQKKQSKVPSPSPPVPAIAALLHQKRSFSPCFPSCQQGTGILLLAVQQQVFTHIVTMVRDCTSKCMPCPACKGRVPLLALQPAGRAQGS